MPKTRRRSLFLSVAAVTLATAVLLPVLAAAQAAVTTLAGRVTDSQDAAASGATVMVSVQSRSGRSTVNRFT